ncbi:MAG: hypothetical protein WC972_04855 [Trueperaceae bacterium]
MTTIAYRDGVLAADTQVNNGSARVGTVQKVHRRADGHMAAGTGDFSYTQRFIAWFLGGEAGEPPLPKRGDDGNDEGQGFIFRPDGRIVCFEGTGPNELTAPYWAQGSGRNFALGAMAHGASAEEAVQAAMRHDVWTGGEITVIHQ